MNFLCFTGNRVNIQRVSTAKATRKSVHKFWRNSHFLVFDAYDISVCVKFDDFFKHFPTMTINIVNQHLLQVSSWFHANTLTVDPNKSKFVLFPPKHTRLICQASIAVHRKETECFSPYPPLPQSSTMQCFSLSQPLTLCPVLIIESQLLSLKI